jgi:HSP20 family molecular chaperone IbpA
MFKEFDNIFNLLDKYFAVFDRNFYKSECVINTNRPYKFVDTEKQNVLILNIAGIDPKDVKVNTYTENKIDYLEIKGSSKNTLIEEDFIISTRFMINLDEIEKIDVDSVNGLLYVRMYKKEPEKKKIQIIYK